MNTLDIEEAARFLKCHPDTVREYAASGDLPAAKVGRAWVFVDVDLVDWLRSKYAACRSTRSENIGTTLSFSMESVTGEPHTRRISGKRKKSMMTCALNSSKESLADLL